MSTTNSAMINKIMAKEVDPRKLMYGMQIIQQPLVHNYHYYLNRFYSESGPPAFTNIKKVEVQNYIHAWINSNKYTINQGGSSLCGPASFFVALLRRRPTLYVKAVTELYLYGITKIGNLVIIPSDKTKNAKLKGKIDGADWVILASLRDSENTSLRYDDPSKEFAGITMPSDMVKWFKQAGATQVTHDYGIAFPKGINNLAAANDKFKNGFSVCLFVNMAMIANVMFTPPSPNHWVLLTSTITSDNKILTPIIAKKISSDITMAEMSAGEDDPDVEYDLQFQIFTWGNKNYIVHRKKSDTKDILNYYYGYVAAKW